MPEPFVPRNDEPLMQVGLLMNHATVTEEDVAEAGDRWKASPPDEDWQNLPDAEVVEE